MSRSWLRRLFSRKVSPIRTTQPSALQPLLRLEDRITPAFNTTISALATANVAVVTAAGTTTYTANAAGANVAVADVATELMAGNNVVIDSGLLGTEAGNISTFGPGIGFANKVGTSLTLQTGSGVGLVGDITIIDISFAKAGSFIATANGSFSGSGLDVTSIDLRAATGSVASSATLKGSDLFVSAATGIGSSGTPLPTTVVNLTAVTAGAGAGIFVAESDDLKLANVNGVNGVSAAGGGTVSLATTNGDIDTNGRTVFSGASPIDIKVGGLDQTFNNASGLVQTLNKAISITADHVVLGNQADSINAGTGDVTLTSFTSARPINLGLVTDPNGTLSISDAELDTISATVGLVTIGDSSSGTITVSATITFPHDLTLISGAGLAGSGDIINGSATATTLTIDQAGNSTYSGALGGPSGGTANDKNLAFVKLKAGVLTLTGNSTYTGTTTVSAGSLLVNGTSGVGTTTVKSGATLGGTGTIGKSNSTDVTVESGGTLSPGDGGVGTLTIGDDLTLDTGSTLVIDVVGTKSDQVIAKKTNIGDGVNLLGTSTLPLIGAAYTIISGSISTTGNGFKDVNGTNLTPNKGGPILLGTTQFNYDYSLTKFRLTAIGTTVSIDGGGNLVINDVTDKDDTLTISRVGANIRVFDPNNAMLAGAGVTQIDTNTVEAPFANITGKINVTTGKGDDFVSLLLAGGIIPTAGITFDGGNTGQDSLAVTGSGVEIANYTPSATTIGSGVVSIGGKNINFSNLEPLDISGMLSATVTLPGANDQVDVINGFDDATGAIPALVVSGKSAGVAFEAAHLFDNTTATIDTTVSDGVDTITITSADNVHKNTNLIINTGTKGDTLTINGAVAADGDIKFTSNAITVNADITVATRDIVLTATDTATVGADKITVKTGVTVVATAGITTLQAGDDVVIDGTVKATAKAVTITAAFGDADAGGAINAAGTITAGTDVTLSTRDDITLATVNAGATGVVTVSSSVGNIFDDDNDATVISGDKLTLSAVRAIGKPGALADIDSKVTSVTATTTGAGPFVGAPTPGIWVTDTDALTVTNATTTGDGVILIDAGTSLDAQTVVANGTGRNVRLQALSGDLTIGSVTATGDNVRLSATGKIIDGNVAANNVSATGLVLTAGAGIASSADPLETTIVNLAWTAGTGGLALSNTGALTVASVTAFGTLAGGAGAADQTIKSDGAVAINEVVNTGAATFRISAGGDVTQTKAITAKTLGVNTSGAITLNAANAVDNVALESTGGKAIAFTSANDLTIVTVTADGALFPATTGVKTVGATVTINNAGKTLTGNQAVTSGSKDITLTAKDFVITTAVNAGTACVIVLPGAGNTITLGTGGTLDDVELALITGAVLQIGDFTNSDISVVGTATPGPATLDLRAAGNISSTAAGKLTVTNLALQTNAAANTIDFSLGTHNASVLAIAAAGDATYADSNALIVGAVAVCPSSVPATVTGAVSANGNVNVSAAGLLTISNVVTAKTDVALTTTGAGNSIGVNADVTATSGKAVITAAGSIGLAANVTANSRLTLDGGTGINQTAGKLTDTGLEILGGGTATLKSATNNVATIAINSTGDVTYVDADNLAVGTVGGTVNITATGKAVRLDSVAGKVTGSGATDVSADSLVVKASTGVGPLNTKIAKLEAQTTTGDITINNTGDLAIGGVAADLPGVKADAGTVNITVNTTRLSATTEGISAGTDVNLTADAMTFTQPINGQCVMLTQFTAANKIDLGGADAAGTLALDNTDLASITTTKGLRIGQAAGGAVTVSAAAKAAGPLELIAGAGGIAKTGAGTLEVGQLLLQSTGKVTLDNSNKVSKLAGKSSDDFTFTNDKTVKLALDTVTVCGDTLVGIDASGKKITLTGDLDIKAAITGDCVVFLGANAGAAINLGTEFTDAELDQVKANVVQLGNAATLAVSVSGAISLAAGKVPTLELQTGGTISGAGTLAVQKLIADSVAAVTLGGGNDVDLFAAISTGAITFNDSDDLTVAAITRCDMTILTGVTGASVSLTAATKLSINNIVKATTANIDLNAEAMAIAAGVNAPADCVDIRATKATTVINLGAADAANVLGLTDGELDFVSTLKGLRIGQATTASVQVTAAIDNANQLALVAGAGGITESGAGTLTVSNLQLNTSGTVALNGGNKVTTLAGQSTDGFSFNNIQDLTVGSVTVCDVAVAGVVSSSKSVLISGTAGLNVTQPVSALNGNVTLDTASQINLGANVAANPTTGLLTFDVTNNGVNQTGGGVTGNQLLLTGANAGAFTLPSAQNDVNTFAVAVNGAVNLRDTDDLTVGTIGGTSGVKTTNNLFAATTGTAFIFPSGTTIDLGTSNGEIQTGMNDVNNTDQTAAYVTRIDGAAITNAGGLNVRAGVASNSVVISAQATGIFFLFGGAPTAATVTLQSPGDQLSVGNSNTRVISLLNFDSATGNGVYTFAKDSMSPPGAIVQFFSFEKLIGLTFQAFAVQTGMGDYRIQANAVVNGQAQAASFSAPLPRLAPFLASPNLTNPFGPFDAPYISIGDINGDGVNDIIIGFSSNSGSPLVTVVDGNSITKIGTQNQALATSNLIAQFFAYDPRYQGGVFVAVADFDGDSRAEIVTGPGRGQVPTDQGDGNFVKVFRYLSGPNPATPGKNFDNTNNIVLETRFFAFDPTFLGGVRVAVGDVNGDFIPGKSLHKPDIIVAAGPGGGPLVRIFNGQSLPTSNSASTLAAPATAQFYAYDQSFTGGAFIDAGDYNGDGKADILTGAGFGGGPHIKVFDGFKAFQQQPLTPVDEFFDKLPSSSSPVDLQTALRAGVASVGFADVDGDGRNDIFVGSGLGVRNAVRIYSNIFGTFALPNHAPNREIDTNPSPEFRVDGAHVANSGGLVP